MNVGIERGIGVEGVEALKGGNLRVVWWPDRSA